MRSPLCCKEDFKFIYYYIDINRLTLFFTKNQENRFRLYINKLTITLTKKLNYIRLEYQQHTDDHGIIL